MQKLLGPKSQMAAQLADKGDFAILPRRKAGQSSHSGERAQPISISKAVLEKYFHMSLNQASKELVSLRPRFDWNFIERRINFIENCAGYLRDCHQESLQVCRYSLSDYNPSLRLTGVLPAAGSSEF